MDELELEQCLSTHSKTKNHFRGVHARDELCTKIPAAGDLFIVNTDLRSESGTHWLLCYFTNDGSALYFDSYGVQPFYPEIEEFLRCKKDTYMYNKQRLQADTSNVCGHYVAYVGSQLCAGRDLPSIRKPFSSNNYVDNDKLVVALFRCEFGFPRVLYKSTRKTPMCCTCRNGDK